MERTAPANLGELNTDALVFPPLTNSQLISALATLDTSPRRVYSPIEVCLLTGKSQKRLYWWVRIGLIKVTYKTLPIMSKATIENRIAQGDYISPAMQYSLFDTESLLFCLFIANLDDFSPNLVAYIAETLEMGLTSTDQGVIAECDAIKRWLQKDVALAVKQIKEEIAKKAFR